MTLSLCDSFLSQTPSKAPTKSAKSSHSSWILVVTFCDYCNFPSKTFSTQRRRSNLEWVAWILLCSQATATRMTEFAFSLGQLGLHSALDWAKTIDSSWLLTACQFRTRKSVWRVMYTVSRFRNTYLNLFTPQNYRSQNVVEDLLLTGKGSSLNHSLAKRDKVNCQGTGHSLFFPPICAHRVYLTCAVNLLS